MKFLRRTPLLIAALAAGIVSAQDSSAGGALPNLSTATQTQAASTTGNTNTPASTGGSTTGGSTGGSTTGAASSTKPTTGVSITGGSSDTGTATSIPSITGGAGSTDGGALPSGLPTLSGAYKIVPASVPPTQNAPYMQQSSLPEGTVFIIVAAILGFSALSVLLWRGLVAWSLHRSVKRAAMQQNMSDTKALFRAPPPAPFYKYHDRESTISLSALGGKGGKKGARPTTGQGINSSSSLFFSPTAGAVPGGLNTAGNRASSYLPAGYYAAGAAQAGNAQSHVSLGQGHGPAISLSNLGPSSSTLNLSQGYGDGQRAPSTYLEDLFDGTNEGPAVPGHNPQPRF